MALVEVVQGSVEWIQLRVGIVTGSRVADVMAKLKRKDGEAAVRANYRAEIVSEILSGRAWEHFISREMRWGLENEIFARTAYELHVEGVEQGGSYQVEDGGEQVSRVGFAMHDKIKRFGASPDALVGSDGVAEFKCPNTTTHLDYIIEGRVPAEYQWQMLAEMACTGAKWCDFVSYDPRLPKRLQLYIRRFERDDQRIEEMETEIEKFMVEVDSTIEKLKQSKMIDLDASLEAKLKASQEFLELTKDLTRSPAGQGVPPSDAKGASGSSTQPVASAAAKPSPRTTAAAQPCEAISGKSRGQDASGA